MAERNNPYIAGAPVVEKRMFYGREGVFEWIENSLTGKYVDHILVLHGQRRVGKTSVLKHIPNRLPDKYIPVFIDLQGRVSTTLDRFLNWLAREILRALKEHGIDLPRPDRAAFEEDPDYFETIFLPAVEEKMGERSLLLTFDEFDTFESTDVQEGLAIPFMAILKRLMDHPKLSFVFSIGSSGRKLENMQASYTNFFKQALYRKITFLEEYDARDLIVRPVEGILAYTDDAVRRIIEVTSGHPYFIQLVCHELFSECQKNDHWQVDANDVENILEPVVERGTVNLKFVWDEASDLEKWVLASLATDPDGMSLPELETHLKKEQVRFTRQELERSLLHLKEKDVLRENNDFIIHLLRIWLELNRPMAQVREELEEVNPIVNRLLEIGQEYHDKGEYERAIKNFEDALEAEQENLETHLWLGNSHLARGDYGKAIAAYETVLEVKVDDVLAQKGYCDASLAMGDEFRSEGKVEEAEYAYLQVLSINPNHQEAKLRMAEFHHHKAVNAIVGGEDVALDEMEKALEYAEEAAFKRVHAELKAFIAGERKLSEMLLLWGEQAQEMGLWDEASDLLNKYRREGGKDKSVTAAIEEIRGHIKERRQGELRRRAARLTSLGRFDEAIESWTSYLVVTPEQSGEVKQKIVELQAQAKAAKAKKEGVNPVLRNVLIGFAVILIGTITYLLAQPTSPLMVAMAGPTSTPTATIAPTNTQVPTLIPTLTPTVTPTLIPTQIPLSWSRITSAQFLPRDQVNVIAFHPEDSDVLFIGTSQSGLYKSINGGISWTPSHTGFEGGNIQTILIDHENTDIIYLKINDGGLYKSVDGGENWFDSNNGLNLDFSWAFFSDFAMDPNDSGHLLFASQHDNYESFDGGESWINRFGRNENPCFITEMDFSLDSSLIFYHADNLPGCMVGGLFRAEDGADSGEMLIENTIRDTINESHHVAVNLTNGEIYYAHPNFIYVSLDLGESFEVRGPYGCESVYAFYDGSAYCTSQNGVFYKSNDGWKNYSQLSSPMNKIRFLAVSPTDPNTLFLSGESIYKSTDGGLTWQESANGLGSASNQVVFSPLEEDLYIEVRNSRDLCDLENPSMLYQYRLNTTEAKFIDGKGCGIYLSNNGEKIYRFMVDNNGILLSQDGGVTYAQTGIQNYGENSFNYSGYTEYIGQEMLYFWKKEDHYDTPYDLYLSFDRGKTWEVIENPDFQHPGLLFASPSEENFIWLLHGGYGGGVGLYYSTDGGENWKDRNGPSWSQFSNTVIDYVPSKVNTIYMATVRDGLIEIDKGNSKTPPLIYELRNASVNTVVIDPHDPNIIYVGSNIGFYISYNAGESWGQVNDGLLGALRIYSITVDPFMPGIVYISTPYGIFQLEDK